MKILTVLSFIAVILSVCILQTTDALGTMAIDLGNEFIKVAIVKSGVPMEIALNKESQRKTPAIVSIRGKERFYGSPAESISIKYPAQAYHFIPSLIGKTLDHPSVQSFMQRFPFYELDFDTASAQLVFKQKGRIVFTVEELMAMLLQNSRDVAETYAEEPIKSAVITVPHYFGQAERRALLRAAQLVNLDVHQLINEDSAVALHFGVFRTSTFNSTAQHFMFFNLGSQSASASIVRYEVVKDKSSGIAMDTPQLSVIGVGADGTLGITAFAVKLRDHLAKAFQKQHKLDIFKDHRAMMKLLKESKRVVTVLSANSDTFAQVEYLMAEKDFKLKVTRSEFEELCADLFDRIEPVFDQALEGAQISLAEIKEVILMGGGTRVPKVQDTLMSISGKTELGRSINSDEAAAMGAVYQAAFHSPGFRVKNFLVKDFNYYPIKTAYQSSTSDEDPNSNLVDKEVVLYNRGVRFPQRRALSINKRSSDMDIYVSYAGLDEPYASYLFPNGAKSNANLTVIRLHNVSEAISDNVQNGSRMKGFKVHFDMDYNGILSMLKVEARLETNPAANRSTLQSIGDTISGLFGSNDKDSAEEDKEKTATPPPEEAANSTASAAADNSTSTTPPPVQSEIISIPIGTTVEYLDALTPSEEVMAASRKKLQEIREHEQELMALEQSRNELESYIFNMKERLDVSQFKEFSAEADLTAIQKALDLASEWYEEQDADTPRNEYDRQLLMIKNLVKPVDNRINEHKERPAVFEKFQGSLLMADQFHQLIDEFVREPMLNKIFQNLTADFGVFPFDRYLEDMNKLVREQIAKAFTEDELKTFKELIEENKQWHNKSKEELAKTPKHEDATVKVSDVIDKQGNLVRQMTSIQNKYDNNRRTVRYEVMKWIRAKREELKQESDAKNKTVSAQDSETKEPAAEKEGEQEEPKKEKDDTETTPRSDL